MRNNLLKGSNALGIFKYSSNQRRIGFASNAQSEIIGNRASAMVRPEPCDQIITEPNAQDVEHQAWLNDHPSALRSFEGMMSIAKGKKIVMFLDYDGTLSPIVDDPELAFMSDTMRSAVREVAKNYPTAIISGRSRDKVYEFVQLNDVYYAGSHGMDIMAPPGRHKFGETKYQRRAVDKKGNEVMIFQPAKEFLPEILEDYSLVEKKVLSVLGRHSRFHLTRGRKVLEIRPSIKWNKGNALEYLLETLGFAESSDVLPIYVGDDVTDEDAFKVIQRRGQGFPILVSRKLKATRASYSLRDPSEVLSFLLRLARWRRN
ncbi:hypothetical protein Cgig2_005044 [Carnegiea gigantea]|uniref:Trehalose 6-phosphate phosphatase n=1 Tax=Carnegiea gigantea TaxID=171969 RepID=A0A9Q1L041_9CARY|nr:hypothetical protein Cgig2_005044 [Carnegiea gigantea]